MRAALREDILREALLGGLWRSVEVVAMTGSTNADLLGRGGPEGQVLVAEEQTAGRGRMGRSWVSQPGASLTFSVLLRPVFVAATLKWPNDVLIDDRKLAGILAEQSGDAVVIGIGINVATPRDALPASPVGPQATSLLAEGVKVARDVLLVAVLRNLERWYRAFREDPDPARSGLLAEYRTLCGTLGRSVRVELPGGRAVAGVAEDIDTDGRLLVREGDAASLTPVSAGDVIHLR